jgi:hypothetical protein
MLNALSFSSSFSRSTSRFDRDCLEAAGIALQVWAFTRLAQVQEPEGAVRREAEEDWGRWDRHSARGKYIGKLVGHPPKDEAEHFIRCPPAADGLIAAILLKCSSTKAPCRIQLKIRHNDDSHSFRLQGRSLGPAWRHPPRACGGHRGLSGSPSDL